MRRIVYWYPLSLITFTVNQDESYGKSGRVKNFLYAALEFLYAALELSCSDLEKVYAALELLNIARNFTWEQCSFRENNYTFKFRILLHSCVQIR